MTMVMLPEQFYKERVLSYPSHRVVEFPWPRDHGTIRIEKSLFESRRYYAKNKYFYYSSEGEARYSRIWIEGGLGKIKYLSSGEALQEITIEFEALAKKIYKIADEMLIGYRESTKRKVFDGVWDISESSSS